MRLGDRLGALVRSIARAFASAGEQWVDDEAYRLGASLAYYALFSLFPILLLCAIAFGIALGSEDSSRERVLDFVLSGVRAPEIRSLIDDALAGMQRRSAARGVGMIIALVGLLLGASGVFSELDTAFNRVWRVKNPKLHGVRAIVGAFVHDKLASFAFVALACAAMVGSLGVSILAWTIGERLAAAIGMSWLVHLASPLASGCLGLVASTALFRIVPKIKVPIRDAFAGGLVTTLLLIGLKQLFGLYLSMFTGYAAYGVVGGLLALVTWIYLASQIVLYGAEFSRAWHDARG